MSQVKYWPISDERTLWSTSERKIGLMPSGYDEYEGIFGPLGAASAGHRRSKQRRFPSQTYLPSSTAAGAGPRRRQTTSGGYAKTNACAYLAQRQAKRQSHVAMDEEDDHLSVSALAAPLPERLRRPTASAAGVGDNVWLPSREFSFRQRAGKLDTRTLARVDLAQVVATTDVDTIQRHLENLAFADVTLEDVQQFSDAYFLKLFQIAQLTLEYLMHVQDSLVGHADDLETQCAQMVQEAQAIERENDKFETEISSLKSEIRHKQRTMATLEMLLLNTRGTRLPAAAAGRREKENASGDTNQQLMDDLLGHNGDQEEAGAIGKPVSCVLCGKKFLSAEYLIRHQERKHKKRSSSSASESQGSMDEASGSRRQWKKKGKAKEPALPKHVVKALEEKNELTKQLLALQEQLQKEKEARSLETNQLETHHSQLTANMVQSMSKLQTTLADMESKHEQAKREMMLYTRETMIQMQQDAAAAAARAAQTPRSRSSHVGQLESDEDASGGRVKPSSEADRWTEKMEKLMDTFLRAQAQKQQEVDDLAHENAKLRTKQRKLHKRRTRAGDEGPTLVQMAALEAQRFGLDRGEQSDANMSVQSYTQTIKLQLDDKTVQTDEEAEKPTEKVRPRVFSQEVQTEEKRPPAVVEPPPSKIPVLAQRKEVPKPAPVQRQPSVKSVNEPKAQPKAEEKAAPAPAKEEKAAEETEKPLSAVQSADSKLQHAAHVVGKVALGFLTRRTLVNAENWFISLPLSSLLSALSDQEFARVAAVSKVKHQSDVRIKVEKHMTANALRVAVAQALSDGPQGERGHETIEYHRVLLHLEDTGEELIGDRPVESFRNRIAVEIIPHVSETESYMVDVLSSHAETSSRLTAIKRQAMAIEPGVFSALGGEAKGGEEGSSIRRIVKLQARVRSFLARRQAQKLRIDRLVDARVAHTRALSLAARRKSIDVPSESTGFGPQDAAFGGASDPLVARHVKSVQDRVGALVRQKTGLSSSSGMSTEDFETSLAALEQDRKQLPTDVQTRIQQLLERVNSMVQTAYDPEQTKAKQLQQTAATKIQQAMRISIARKRLQTLLQRKTPSNSPKEDPRTSSWSARQPSVSPLSSSSASSAPSLHEKAPALDKKDEEAFDQLEIEALANAYEQGLALQEEKQDTPHHSRESSLRLSEADAEATTVEPAAASQPGRSPRPTMDSKLISPFSSTKLISRRAALNRSGSGFANHR